MPDPTTMTITQVQWVDPTDEAWLSHADSKAQASILLRDQFAAQGMYPVSDPEPVGDPAPILVNDARDGWEECDEDKANAHIVTWSGTGLPRVEDPEPIGGEKVGDDAYLVTTPVVVFEHGGPVRIRHDLGGPVTVATHADDGTEHPHVLYTETSDDEVHIETYAGTRTIMVTRSEGENDGAAD